VAAGLKTDSGDENQVVSEAEAVVVAVAMVVAAQLPELGYPLRMTQ
jgi:hypothetical protein